jgi:uncharacterized membrane protein YeiH
MNEFLLPVAFDYGATFLWAVSGALIAARRRYDIVGLFSLALVSATGGGLLRDGLFLQQGPPVLVQTPVYLEIVLAASLTVWVFGDRIQKVRGFEDLVSLVDAIGIGAYALVGMSRASAAGLSLLGIVLVGTVNAVGGGLMRDVAVRREPDLFKPGTFQALAALAGCVFFLVLTQFVGWPETPSAWATIALVFLIRILSVRFGFKTTPPRGFEDRDSQPDR